MVERTDLEKFDLIHQQCLALRKALHEVIVGQQSVVELLIVAMLCQGHTLIVGVPGLAKTLLARTLAQSLGLSYRRIQFTPDMMPTDILGTELIQEDPATGQRQLRFLPGPIFSQMILADEINRTPPRTQAALLEAMAERQVTTAGRTIVLEEPFIVIATQNPIEQEGTYPLPEAQLDRFMFSLWMDYPDRRQEVQIVAQGHQIAQHQAQKILGREELLEAGRLIRQMPVSEHVIQYAVDLVRATRPAQQGDVHAAQNEGIGRPGNSSAWPLAGKYIAWGAGPRAAQALVLAAQARAAIQGRPTPSCDDVRAVASAVLRHRLVPNYTATGDRITTAWLIEQLLAEIQEPVY